MLDRFSNVGVFGLAFYAAFADVWICKEIFFRVGVRNLFQIVPFALLFLVQGALGGSGKEWSFAWRRRRTRIGVHGCLRRCHACVWLVFCRARGQCMNVCC